MREIKFKVWIPYSNVMMQPKDIQTLHESILNGVTIGQMKQWHYLQFTGLKDKNGKDIYEGDIIRVRKESGGAWSNPETWAVKYENSSADFRVYNPSLYKETPFYAVHNYQMFEIIGNIYENPELMPNE